MDKPLCRLCKTRHYAHEPHRWKEGEGGEPGGAQAPAAAIRKEVGGKTKSFEGGKLVSARNLDRYREYQREYQKKRRARIKADLAELADLRKRLKERSE